MKNKAINFPRETCRPRFPLYSSFNEKLTTFMIITVLFEDIEECASSKLLLLMEKRFCL